MDYIIREAALKEAFWVITNNGDKLKVIQEETLLGLPAVDVIERNTATVCGYPLEYLITIARIAEKKEITPDMAIEQFEDFKEISKLFIKTIASAFDDTYSRLLAPEVKP